MLDVGNALCYRHQKEKCSSRDQEQAVWFKMREGLMATRKFPLQMLSCPTQMFRNVQAKAYQSRPTRERRSALPRNSKAALIFMLVGAVFAIAGGPGFRTSLLLENHFARYGSQFGRINSQEYLRLAQHLRDATPGKNILISRRPDGGGSKFDVKRGWFVAYDGDGTLRTFFVPRDGVRYFDTQRKGTPSPE
jgi:hypothetical protein